MSITPDAASPAAGDLTRLVTEWVRYARTGTPTFTFADSISLTVGGRPAGAMLDPSRDLHDRNVWRRCPEGNETYGASYCPVDFLSVIDAAAVNDVGLVYTETAEHVTCSPTPGLASPDGRVVIIRPEPQWRTCSGDFALTMGADDQGRLVSVDLTLSAP